MILDKTVLKQNDKILKLWSENNDKQTLAFLSYQLHESNNTVQKITEAKVMKFRNVPQ